jgi:endonuclease III
MTEIEQKRRLVRALRSQVGRGFAEACGFTVIANPARLFQILYLAILLTGDRDYRRAVRLAKALRDRGWESPARMARARHDERAALIKTAGRWRDADTLAATLGDLAQTIVDRYRGDLRRLRSDARRDPGRERELLKKLPGVDDRVVDLFFREVQVLWPEVAPFVDRRALAAARKLELGRSVADLSALTGGRESEKLAWLAGALARVDLDNRYDEIRASVRG